MHKKVIVFQQNNVITKLFASLHFLTKCNFCTQNGCFFLSPKTISDLPFWFHHCVLIRNVANACQTWPQKHSFGRKRHNVGSILMEKATFLYLSSSNRSYFWALKPVKRLVDHMWIICDISKGVTPKQNNHSADDDGSAPCGVLRDNCATRFSLANLIFGYYIPRGPRFSGGRRDPKEQIGGAIIPQRAARRGPIVVGRMPFFGGWCDTLCIWFIRLYNNFCDLIQIVQPKII